MRSLQHKKRPETSLTVRSQLIAYAINLIAQHTEDDTRAGLHIKNGQKVLITRRKVTISLILPPQIATIRDPLIPHNPLLHENTRDRRKLENEWLIRYGQGALCRFSGKDRASRGKRDQY